MILNLWRYAFGGAKVMALKSYLLGSEDYHFLLRARNLEEMVGYLRTTAYGPALAGWDWRRPDAEAELSRRVYGDLAQAFVKVRRGLQKREADFVGVLAQRLVAENLKVVLRALHQGLPPNLAASRLLPLESLSPLDFQGQLNAASIPRLVDMLSGTPWGRPLKRGLDRFSKENSLFPLEMSLDLWVYGRLWAGLAALEASDRSIAGRILGTLVDITNIIWAGRFREIYRFPGEEIYQYLIEAGSFRSQGARRDLAFAAGVADMTARLPREIYVELLQGAPDLAAVEERLRQHWLEVLGGVLVQPPFQIGLPITYLFLKELEVDNVLTLFTGMILKVPEERLALLIRRRQVGVDHV